MKNIYNFTVLLILISTILLNGQTTEQISVGPSYSQQSYYDLESGSSEYLENTDWELAFALTSPTEAGIHINESIKISFTQELPKLLLFKLPIDDFNATVEVSTLTDTISNNEVSWAEGALNSVKDDNDPFDYGWGKYNSTNHAIEGTSIYVVQLRNKQYKKFMIESLSQGVYTLKSADLDGANEKVESIDKADHDGSHLILYSFDNGVLDFSTKWDLFFGRYETMLSTGDGNFIPYTVSGIISAPGIQVAQAEGVDYTTVNYDDYSGELTDSMRAIGHDFKYYDFSEGWVIRENLTYFVKNNNGKVWKLRFLDFEGSSTGTLTVERTDLGLVSTNELNVFTTKMKVYPNPISSNQMMSLVFESEQKPKNANVSLINMSGQVIFYQQININKGLNALEFKVDNLPAGSYIVKVASENGILSNTVQIH